MQCIIADLVLSPDAPGEAVLGPGACLFAAAPGEAPGRASRLERRWDHDPGGRPERFAIRPLRAPGAPLPLALAEHDDPMGDVEPAWRVHPNGAVALEGLRYAGGAPGGPPGVLGPPVAPGALLPCSEELFSCDFGTADPRRLAARVRVRSLDGAARALTVPHRRDGERLLVAAGAGVPCGFEFRQG